MKKQLLFAFLLLSFSQISISQSNLFIDTTFTIEEMVMDFFDDPSITVSNINHQSNGVSAAFFDAGGTDLGIDAGIVLSTGNVFSLIGASDSSFASSNLGADGDADINAIGNSPSFDAALLEFDFTVSETDTLHFNYVFGSEEYPEWVGSAFNDAFAFLISGPGITGPFSNNAQNISMVPNSTDEVAINTVNAMQNTAFFVDNENGEHISLDGFTVPLPSSFFAEAGETYHIKLVIADRSDAVLDSGVFLSFNSLNQNGLLSPPSNFQAVVNTATNQVEFTNESKYARSWQWDFGNGETSNERHPGVINYDSPGDYMVTLTTQNYCCTDVFTSMVSIGTGTSTFDNNEITVKLFPNPVVDRLQVEWLENNSVEQVFVLNVLGQSIPIQYDLNGNMVNISFDKNSEKGTYFLQLFFDDGKKATARFVVEGD